MTCETRDIVIGWMFIGLELGGWTAIVGGVVWLGAKLMRGSQ